MSQPASTEAFKKEQTFTNYNKEQGKAYAQGRPGYHPTLYQYIIDTHIATGGQLDTLLDVGSGPGTAVRALGVNFSHAIGLDPSESMVATARSLGGATSTAESIRFEVSTAEDLGTSLSNQPIPNASVDLITAANSAHWFNMSQFWTTAARILKPGGSVVMWTSGKTAIHPSVPNSAAIDAALNHLEETHLTSYMVRGNLMTRNRYIDLPLPWTLDEPISGFDQSAFVRKEWDIVEDLFAYQPEASLDAFENMFKTMSTVTRWYEAHPDAIGTERDISKIYRRTIERLLHEAGVGKGKEMLKGAMHGMTLTVKRSA